jgi:acyl dehydratase
MPVDVSAALAYRFEPLEVTVERGRLALFAKATGQTDPVYSDPGAAKAAGHRDLPVPPSFYFSLDLERPDPFRWMADLSIDLDRVLHGEQSFTYHAMAYAGDVLTVQSCLVDVAVKKAGALELLTRKSVVTRATELVAEAVSLIIVRNPEAGR